MAKYIDAGENVVQWTDPDDGYVYCIHLSSDGPERARLQYWLDAGNTIDSYVAPEITEVSRHQFYKQLKASNKISQIRALASTWADDSDARIEWEAGGLIKKDGPLVAAVKTELSLTDAQINSFFEAASQL